jgi:hypothetical protein
MKMITVMYQMMVACMSLWMASDVDGGLPRNIKGGQQVV